MIHSIIFLKGSGIPTYRGNRFVIII